MGNRIRITTGNIYHSLTVVLCGAGAYLVIVAAPFADATETLFPNPIAKDDLGELLLVLVDGVVTILIPLVTLGIVFIGFKMVLSAGSRPEEFTKWRTSLLYALLGLFLVLGAKGILGVIKNTVGQVLSEARVEYVQIGEVVSLSDTSSTTHPHAGQEVHMDA